MGVPHALLDANQGQVIAANLCRNTSSVLDKSLLGVVRPNRLARSLIVSLFTHRELL